MAEFLDPIPDELYEVVLCIIEMEDTARQERS